MRSAAAAAATAADAGGKSKLKGRRAVMLRLHTLNP